MHRLEDLTPGAQVRGVLPGGPVTLVGVKWYGSNALELTYKDCEGRPNVTLLYRDHEPALEILQPGRQWKRNLLGRMLGKITRHFLLMTATPHSGKEKDFQLFMSLLDSNRFEGKFRDGVHVVDVADLMCRCSPELSFCIAARENSA
jgi:hypothetical protein